MKRFLVFSVLILLVSIGFGCKQRTVTQPEQQPSQEMKEGAKAPSAEEVTEQKMASKVESVEESEMASRKMMEKEGMFNDILFDFDKYNVKDMYKPELKKVSSWMMDNPDAKILVEGHTDERGTNEYNLALGDRRANAVKDYLVSLGVSSSRIETISYGEEKPLCTESDEECWQKNRRAHFVVMNKAGK
jgi:peptidoglycan-associated lipoprotein